MSLAVNDRSGPGHRLVDSDHERIFLLGEARQWVTCGPLQGEQRATALGPKVALEAGYQAYNFQ